MADNSPVPDIISRQEAKARGLTRYFTGKPCKHGHIAERLFPWGVCVQCNRERALEWQRNNPDKVAIRNKKFDDSHPENVKQRHKTYRNKPEIKDANRLYLIQWLAEHPGYMTNHNREYTARRMKEDLNFKLRIMLRTRLNVAIKRGYRAGSAVRDLGCSIEEFRAYIEAQFDPGMYWWNWGEWELDHIKPLADFDLRDRTQFLDACHFSNIRPLWKADNRRQK